jgi:hypothetical protein
MCWKTSYFGNLYFQQGEDKINWGKGRLEFLNVFTFYKRTETFSFDRRWSEEESCDLDKWREMIKTVANGTDKGKRENGKVCWN